MKRSFAVLLFAVFAVTTAASALAETTLTIRSDNKAVQIPPEDFVKYNVTLATEMDGKELTLRDKGSMWVVYPRDEHAELDDPEVNSRWIWQLVEIQIE